MKIKQKTTEEKKIDEDENFVDTGSEDYSHDS